MIGHKGKSQRCYAVPRQPPTKPQHTQIRTYIHTTPERRLGCVYLRRHQWLAKRTVQHLLLALSLDHQTGWPLLWAPPNAHPLGKDRVLAPAATAAGNISAHPCSPGLLFKQRTAVTSSAPRPSASRHGGTGVGTVAALQAAGPPLRGTELGMKDGVQWSE